MLYWDVFMDQESKYHCCQFFFNKGFNFNFLFRDNARKLINSLTSFSEERNKHPECWNLRNTEDWGVFLCHGLKAFAECDYETALNMIKPIRFDYQTRMAGSRAQMDVFNQVLIQSAIRSGDRKTAKQLLQERWAHCSLDSYASDTGEPNLNRRLEAKLQSLM